MSRKNIFITSSLICITLLSCSTQHILLNPKTLYTNQTVTIETSDGEKVSGTVILANSEAVLMHDSYGDERGFLTKHIVGAKGPEPVLDENKVIVTEAEIDSFQTNTNLATHAIVGGIISGGVSFLASSLLTREAFNNDSDVPIYIGTTVGTTIGTILFANSGKRKDREQAIAHVIESRTEPGYEISLPDQQDDIMLKEKIIEIMKEREKMEEEIDRLLKDMDKIEEPAQEK